MEKFVWIINHDKYDALRKIEGCEGLTDLNATPTDCAHILEIAKKLRVSKTHIFHDENADKAAFNATYKKLLLASRKLN